MRTGVAARLILEPGMPPRMDEPYLAPIMKQKNVTGIAEANAIKTRF